MNAADNKALVQQIFAALAEGDSRPYFDRLHADFTFTIMGGTAWRRTWTGKESVMRDLHGSLRDQYADAYQIQATRILADGDDVVVEAEGSVRTKRGDRYDNRYCFVYLVRDGWLMSVREYADSALVDRVLDPPASAGLPPAAPGR